MPKELVCTEPYRLAWREYDEPPLGAGQVRVRAEFGAAKHGTEMAFFKGYLADHGGWDEARGIFSPDVPVEPYPCPVGNMTVGTVTEVGPDVTALAAGDRVLAYAGFRETLTLDTGACWKVTPELAWQSAVCLDPADFAMGAVRDGRVRVGDAVAVFGLGAIGLFVVQLARLSGAGPIVALDPVEARRDAAAGMGADLVLDPTACDAGAEVRAATDGRGADVVIEYSGAAAALQAALRGVAYGGTVVAGAFPPPYAAGLDFGAEAHVNIPEIVFSRSCSEPNRDHPRWNERRIQATCLRLFIEGRLCGEKVVTPVVPFAELPQVYPEIAKGAEFGIKLGTEYPAA